MQEKAVESAGAREGAEVEKAVERASARAHEGAEKEKAVGSDEEDSDVSGGVYESPPRAHAGGAKRSDAPTPGSESGVPEREGRPARKPRLKRGTLNLRLSNGHAQRLAHPLNK